MLKQHHAPHALHALGALLVLLIALGGGLFAPAAGAATVQEATLSMTSDEGDFIGGGQTYAYDSSAGDTFGAATTAATVAANVQGANGDWWYLNFAAPQGETLATGTYDGATRWPFQAPSDPGLDVTGNGRGCNTSTGSFTVTQLTMGAAGAIESFDADFEQHCEGADPALRGHVHIVLAPAPPPLEIGLAPQQRRDRRPRERHRHRPRDDHVQPADIGVHDGRADPACHALRTGHRKRVPLSIPCDGPTPWQAQVTSQNSVPFGAGTAQLCVNASAFDSETGQLAVDSDTATVRLTR